MAASEKPFGFHPYIRLNRLGILAKLPRKHDSYVYSAEDELSLSGASHSFRTECHVILEAPFWFDFDTSVEELFDMNHVAYYGNRITMRVLKARDRSILSPFNSFDPYTDNDHIILGFDDLMTVFMSL